MSGFDTNLDEPDPPYYRVYLSEHDEFIAVNLQSFDEHDYDQNRFLFRQKFEIEGEADKMATLANAAIPKAIRLAACIPDFGT